MLFRTLYIVGSWLLDLLAVLSSSDHDKDLELLILRHQIGFLKRKVKKPKVSRLEKLSLALLTYRLNGRPHQGLDQRIPMMPTLPNDDKGPVRCLNVTGGVIRDDYRQAA